MVKPGLTSLDLIRPIQERTGLQVGAYQVSGEYAGMSLLAEQGLIKFEEAPAGNLACVQARGRTVHHYVRCALCEEFGNLIWSAVAERSGDTAWKVWSSAFRRHVRR
jgi:hypothetical protein